MLTFVHKYGKNVFSQNFEDGLIEEILIRIAIIESGKKKAIEFGGHDGYFCSNTRNLESMGFELKMYDINPGSVEVEQKEITPDNVNELPECFILSVDCDGPDYWIWKAYTGKPAIVIIEINSSIPPTVDMIPGDRGASYKSMVELGISKGYFLLAHTGNLIFCLNKYKNLFPEVIGDGLSNYQDYFNTSFL